MMDGSWPKGSEAIASEEVFISGDRAIALEPLERLLLLNLILKG